MDNFIQKLTYAHILTKEERIENVCHATFSSWCQLIRTETLFHINLVKIWMYVLIVLISFLQKSNLSETQMEF